MKHIHGFDGLRAFAVLSVMFYHLGWPGFGFGWAGVPFFFVLSGFLITGILLDNKEDQPRHFFTTFYMRRTLRIFPLYFAFLGIVFVWCAFLGIHTQGWWYFILYVQNYYLGAREFQLIPGQDIAHTWSLAVEEQFYLLWPLIVYFVSTKRLKLLIAALIVVSIVSRYLLATKSHFVAFAPLSSNFDTLCLGAYLAIVRRDSPRLLNRTSVGFFVAGVLAIAWNVVYPGFGLNASNTMFMLAQAFFFAGIVGITACYRFAPLGWKPLAYTGKISYGLYILHAFSFNVFSVAIYNHWMPDLGKPVMDTLRLIATFAIAVASFHLMEAPILRLKDRFSYGARSHKSYAARATV